MRRFNCLILFYNKNVNGVRSLLGHTVYNLSKVPYNINNNN